MNSDAVQGLLPIDLGLSDSVLRKIVDVSNDEPGIVRASIFGSRASGQYRSGSDIDLAIEGASLSMTQISRVETALDDLLLPWKIDLVHMDTVNNDELLRAIRRSGREILNRTRDGDQP